MAICVMGFPDDATSRPGGVGAVTAEQAVLTQQPEIAGARDGLARRLRFGVGGVVRRLLRIRRACRTAPLGGIRGQSLGRVAVGHGISICS